MSRIPSRAARRLAAGLKKYCAVLTDARARDVNESDTATIVTDVLQDVFGYDKYTEVRSEQGIRGSRCDLAVRVDDELVFLIEIKAVGLDLKDNHLRQSVNYAANQGVDWVVLTNGILWRIYKVFFSKPIDQELVAELDFLSFDASCESDLERLFLLSKEGLSKSQLDEYAAERRALSRFMLGAVLQSRTVIQIIRRELRRCSPGVRIEEGDIRKALEQEVIKREVLEGEEAKHAERRVARSSSRRHKSMDEEPSLPGAGPTAIAPSPLAAATGSVSMASAVVKP